MKSLMLLLVLAGANVKEYDAYDPIVITLSKDAVPEGYKRVIFWNVADENLSYHQVGRETLHCWAPPGEYILFANVLLTNFDTQDQIPKTTKIQFKVKSPEPAPPGPTPTPYPYPYPNSQSQSQSHYPS